ncbi:MAG: DUF1540 domain-containing protein [Lachnospiraceae bacterium]|nr:DUF1540 domain-containing protein [Robinsoniella sp.]MDY3766355.1 DUF1540 domain-containing protein [Lachnospiraceae bacterium]
MPYLVCSAQGCVYNEAMYCCKGDIQVGGETATRKDETCCDSFVERRQESAKSSMGTPSQKIQIDCKACHCTYNEDRICNADRVDISGANACHCDQTACQTFVKEN